MQTTFSLAQLADPHIAESDKILRACVHCGFCTATCPTYVLLGDEFNSPRGRIYLIKEMLEHDRPATGRSGQAHRPLPLMSRLHDDVPFRRALHAPGRSRPRPHRADLSPAAGRPFAARVPRPRDAVSGAAASGDAGGTAGQAAGAAVRVDRLEADRRGAPARAVAQAGADDGPAGLSREGYAPRSRRADGGLRQRGAGALNHPGDHPPAQPARYRSCGGAGRRLLRLAEPSHGSRGRSAGAGPRQYRRLDPRARRRGARRHPDHHFRLRHHGEGLRLHAAHRSRPMRPRPPRCPRWPATCRNIWRNSI